MHFHSEHKLVTCTEIKAQEVAGLQETPSALFPFLSHPTVTNVPTHRSVLAVLMLCGQGIL